MIYDKRVNYAIQVSFSVTELFLKNLIIMQISICFISFGELKARKMKVHVEYVLQRYQDDTAHAAPVA